MKRGCFFAFFSIKGQKNFFFVYFEGKMVLKRIIIRKKYNRLFNLYEYGKKVIIRI